MCGFTGFFAIKAGIGKPELHSIGTKMTNALAHRGPDSDGVWQDPDVALVLGHRRLSILDLSDDGAQPMVSHSDRYVLVYNGEVYNYRALREELKALGHVFQGHSDTEVILAGFDEWGYEPTLHRLNGMFALALWDRKERIIHLARDRMGQKPFYVGYIGDNVAFSSELKAFFAHGAFKPKINRDVLALYMRKGYVAAPYCIYQNVWSLPSGFMMSIDTRNIKPGMDLMGLMSSYWNHRDVIEYAKKQPINTNKTTIINEFEDILSQCVDDRLVSDVPLGAFLSGGIDSSAIVALMQRNASAPVKTYSIGFDEAGFDEAPYAKNIAQHLGTDHHEMYVSSQDTLDLIPKLPEIYDEPFADISAIPTYLVSKFARQDVSVALSGDGGDEMLGGYNRHIFGPKIWNRTRIMPQLFRNIVSNTIQSCPVEKWDSLKKNAPQFGVRMHKAAGILSLNSQEDIYEHFIAHWRDNAVIRGEAVGVLRHHPQWEAPADFNFAECMMYWDSLSYLPNGVLVKVDRATMANGLEARAPLLDQRIFEYAWRLPHQYKVRGGQGKWVLRQVLHKYVPRTLFERPKQGFTMPVGAWLRGPLKEWAEALLDQKTMQQQGLFNSEMVRKVWEAHMRGEGHYDRALWTILMFQAWYKKWMSEHAR